MQSIHVQGRGTPLPKCWRACVGAGAAQDGLRADWQRQLGQTVRQCGFQGVRLTGWSQLGQQGWQALDTLADYLMELAVAPVWRIGAQESPTELEAMVRHCIARYGIASVRDWRFELPAGDRYVLRRQAIKALDDELDVGAAMPLCRLKRFCLEQEADFVTVCAAPDISQLHSARRTLATSAPDLPMHWDSVRAAYGMDDALHLALRLSQLHLSCTLLAESFALASFSGLCGEGAYMIDAYGVQQPCSHAYRMLAALGEEELCRGAGWVLTRDGQGRMRALAWSDLDSPARLRLTGLKPHTRLMQETLDAANGWAYPVWREMGCPEVLTRYQTQALRHAALHTGVHWTQTDAQGALDWRLPRAQDALILLKEC